MPMRLLELLMRVLVCMFGLVHAAAFAQSVPMTVGYTGISEFAPLFVAKDHGFFAQRGLDVELKRMTLTSTIPAALVSGSLQVGGTTGVNVLQAVDSGLNLKVIAGVTVTMHTDRNFAAVRRPGVPIRSAADFVGKKVGVPGLGAFLHVAFRKYLIVHGVDYRKVTFVEVQIPQMRDALRSSLVDSVIAPDPFLTRIVQSGSGEVVSYFAEDLPDSLPSSSYVASAQWVEAHQQSARAFREALTQGVAWVAAHPEEAWHIVGKYLSMPPEVLATIRFATLDATQSQAQYAMWVSIMREQDMLRNTPDLHRLIFN